MPHRNRPNARKIALWRAEGEFWGIGSPFAYRAAVGDTPKGRSRAEKIGRLGEPVEHHVGADARNPVLEPETRWTDRKSPLPGRFRLPCPLDRSAHVSAWLFWKAISTVGFGGVLAIGARSSRHIPNQQKRAGEAGSSWGCRVGGSRSDPGRPKAASRRGEAPRGGVFFFFWVGRCDGRGVIHRQGYPKTHRSPSDSRFFLDSRFRGPQTRRKLGKMALKSERWGRVA